MSLSTLAAWFLWAALGYVAVDLAARLVRTAGSRDENPAFSEIKIWLLCLLENGYDGENVLFCDTRGRRFIRFRKYIEPGGAAGIELTFPEIGWGKDFVPKLKDYAGRKDLAIKESEESEPGYLRITLGTDINEAFALCRMIWSGFYGYSEAARYLPKIGDLSDIEELMADSDHTRLSVGERMDRLNRYDNARLRHAGLGWLQAAGWAGSAMRLGVLTFVSGMSFQAALIGLPLSAVLSLDDPLEWQIDLGPIALQGSTASLILFAVYLVAIAVLRRCLRIRLIDRQSMTRFEQILHAPRSAVIIAIPIAVVLVWLGI